MSKIKILLLSALGLAVLLFVSFYVLGQYSKSGQAAGTVDGALSRCSVKPNCVCSEYADDVAHYIEPVAGMSNAAEFDLLEVQSIIKDMGGEVQRADEHYVAAVFSSLVFGFVDDFEVRFDPSQGIVHLRSASRVGYGDRGVNQKRALLFKDLYHASERVK